MILLSILRATWRNKSFLLRLIVIISLISVTVLDSIGIITTYYYDNRLTVVRTEKGNDGSAFMENITIRYTHVGSVLPNSWLDELNLTNVLQSEFYSNIRREVLSGEMSLIAINKSSIEAKAYAICFFELLSQYDRVFGMDCLLHGRRSCNSSQFLVSSNDINYSRILRETNSSGLVMLQEEAWSYFLDTFVSYYDRTVGKWVPNNYTNALIIHDILNGEMSIEFDPAKAPKANAEGDGSRMTLRLNEHRQSELENEASSVLISVGSSYQNVEFRRNFDYTILIGVKNLGIFDKSRTTTKCSRDPEITFFFGEGHPQCDDRGFLKAIVEKCECIPFTAKKHVRKLSLDLHRGAIPYCDLRHYDECSAEVGPMELDPKVDCIPSCLTIRNQYTFSVETKPCDNAEHGCPDVYFTIISSDHSFVVYEDRYQTSFPQFMSQLGGDMGLYLGLSLLSVWQVVAFIHRQYRRYKTEMRSNGKKTGFSRKQFLMTTFKEIKKSIGSTGEDEDESMKRSTRKEVDEETRWKEREAALTQKIMTAIEQKMEHQQTEVLVKLTEVVESKLSNYEKSAPSRMRKIEK